MRVITGAITSIHRGKRLDGTGSDEQVDFDDDKIKISVIDADWNNENAGGGLSGILNGLKSTKGSFDRSTLILSAKTN